MQTHFAILYSDSFSAYKTAINPIASEQFAGLIGNTILSLNIDLYECEKREVEVETVNNSVYCFVIWENSVSSLSIRVQLAIDSFAICHIVLPSFVSCFSFLLQK